MAVAFACECGQELRAANREAGMYARCPRCRAVLQVPPLDSNGEAAASDNALRFCLACGDALAEGASTSSCEQCGALYHADCWQERGRCLAPQCPSRLRWRPAAVASAGSLLCPYCGEPLPNGNGRCLHCNEARAFLASASLPGKKPRTSYSAGSALIAAGCAIVFFMLLPPGQLAFISAAIAAAALGLGIFALHRIRKSAEPIRGIWAASSAIALAALALLKFAIDLIAAF